MTVAHDAVTLLAPAKINLNLHVCGKRPDGYHLLDSLVCFAGIGDRITARPSDDLGFEITGPFASALAGERNNLVLRAARFLAERHGRIPAAHLVLEKRLPVASGIGGGSADAAATLLACGKLWSVDTGMLHGKETAAALGADVPVCLAGTPARMTGIGEELSPVPPLPPAWLVLVNVQKLLATKEVFGALQGRRAGPAPTPPRFDDAAALASYLSGCTNDLTAPAIELLADIKTSLSALESTPGCLLARMSGSGPTCFGLYANADEAEAAATAIATAEPSWWSVAASILRPDTGTGGRS